MLRQTGGNQQAGNVQKEEVVRREDDDREEGMSFIKLLGITRQDVLLYDVPDRTTEPAATLPFNTTVYVLKEDSHGWAYVVTETGEMGYAPAAFIRIGLPEPTAKLHKVTPGQTAWEVAQLYYSDRFDDSYGRGIRYFIAVLYTDNFIKLSVFPIVVSLSFCTQNLEYRMTNSKQWSISCEFKKWEYRCLQGFKGKRLFFPP